MGKSEPFYENGQVVAMNDGPDRNGRFAIEFFAYSQAFYKTLVPADIHR